MGSIGEDREGSCLGIERNPPISGLLVPLQGILSMTGIGPNSSGLCVSSYNTRRLQTVRETPPVKELRAKNNDLFLQSDCIFPSLANIPPGVWECCVFSEVKAT